MVLLSTRALFDFASGIPAILALCDAYPENLIFVSPVSVGRIQSDINELDQSDPNTIKLEMSLRPIVARADIHGNIPDFDLRAAYTWARFQHLTLPVVNPDGSRVELGDDSRMVLATALSMNLAVIEQTQPYHAHLRAATGLNFIPY